MLPIPLKQIINRKKNNLWILTELLFVFVLVWYFIDYFFVLTYNYSIPSNEDTEHTFLLDLGTVPPKHQEFDPSENTSEEKVNNFMRIFNILKNDAEIESIGICFNNSYPYSGSWTGNSYYPLNDTTKQIQLATKEIARTGDYFRVFRLNTGKGKAPLSINNIGNVPGACVISKDAEKLLFGEKGGLNRSITNDGKTISRVKAISNEIKRFDYERPEASLFNIINQVDTENVDNASIVLRSKADIGDDKFRDDFKNTMFDKLRKGNYYLNDLYPFEKIKKDTDFSFGVSTDIKTREGILCFLLLNILLCIVGSFWYRVNTRKEEIGIYMAVGASRKSIKCRFISEGLCLLLIVFIPAVIIEYQFVHAGLTETISGISPTSGFYLPDYKIIRFLITNLITGIIMSATIIISTYLPAWRASRVNPAEVLKNE